MRTLGSLFCVPKTTKVTGYRTLDYALYLWCIPASQLVHWCAGLWMDGAVTIDGFLVHEFVLTQ